MQNQHLPAAIMWKYGVFPNVLTCLDGQIEKWPEDILGPIPDDATQERILSEYAAFKARPTPTPTPSTAQLAIDTAIADLNIPASLKAVLKAVRPKL